MFIISKKFDNFERLIERALLPSPVYNSKIALDKYHNDQDRNLGFDHQHYDRDLGQSYEREQTQRFDRDVGQRFESKQSQRLDRYPSKLNEREQTQLLLEQTSDSLNVLSASADTSKKSLISVARAMELTASSSSASVLAVNLMMEVFPESELNSNEYNVIGRSMRGSKVAKRPLDPERIAQIKNLCEMMKMEKMNENDKAKCWANCITSMNKKMLALYLSKTKENA